MMGGSFLDLFRLQLIPVVLVGVVLMAVGIISMIRGDREGNE